jgi:hypothetical protein
LYASARTLLTRIIDYAGTFPPAGLPLDQALRNFGRYLDEPDAWLLGRFICAADRLKEIVPLVQELALPDRTLSFSILGRGGKSAQEFFKNVEADVADMQAFAGACPGLVITDGYEVRLPAALFEPIKNNQIGAAIATMAFLLEKGGIALAPFVEVATPTRENVQAAILALGEDRHSAEAARRQLCQPCGFKLRSGGLEASAFPAPELVAAVLAGCRTAHVPFKATAGLHHPFRRHDPSVGSKMHGFVNVFVAGCMSHAHDLPVAQVQALLEEEDGKAFVLDEGGITWRARRLTSEQIAQARRELATSFGSCSVDEPRADLLEAGWLP